MYKYAHCRLIDQVEDGAWEWQVYFVKLHDPNDKDKTLRVAVRNDTTFPQFCESLEHMYDVTNVLVQDALFVKLIKGSMIGTDKVIGERYIKWKKT